MSELISVLNNLQTTAKAAVVAVKSTFAMQSAAVNRSLASLEMAASQLTNSQTRAAAIVQLPLEIKAAQTTLQRLVERREAGLRMIGRSRPDESTAG